jgi:hypothetical protein
MTARADSNRRFLADLFGGPFRGHAITFDHEAIPSGWLDDYAISPRPLQDWLPWVLRNFEARVRWHETLGDDSVPYANLHTGTELFAASFGCPVQLYEGMPPAARPLVTTAAEADALEVPRLDVPPLSRVFEFARLVRERVGPGVPVSVPDIQSPFDIAALVWRKQDLFLAMHDQPEAVKRLADKCLALLTNFLTGFKREFPEANLCHCPANVWAPPAWGCSLSEDEAGSMSAAMFEEFCLPSLVNLSESFGGLFMHCCAAADHQYDNFGRIPNLRGLNRVFQSPAGPRLAIDAFSGHTVLVMAWISEQDVYNMLDLALPDTRFFFNMPQQPLEDAKRTYERLRARCPRN